MKKTVVGMGMFAVLAFPVASQAQEYPRYNRLSISAVQEFGQLSKPIFDNNYAPDNKNEWVDHFGAFVTQSVAVNERLLINIGLGGVFQFQKQESARLSHGASQYRDFYIGPTVADLNYTLGDVRDPSGTIQFGMFPYKYSKSSNLGEYLFRSGPYPGFLWTGGYTVISSPAAYLQGLRLGWSGIRNLDLNLFVTTETGIPPLYDMTVTGLAKYAIADGLLEVGGGVQFKRLISIHPSDTRKETDANSYFKVNGQYYSGNTDYYGNQATFWKVRRDSLHLQADSLRYTQYQADRDSVQRWVGDPTISKSYYTSAGTTVIAMASLDGKKLVPSERWGARDLELYTEVALLGVKNYPVFYENRLERMPVMVGFNVPTLKLLDLLSVEMEWFYSPWPNSYESLESQGAFPTLPSGSAAWVSEDSYNDIKNKDNVSWSILAQKNIAGAITISGQVARDHARFVGQNKSGPGMDPREALSTSKDWYWMLQFSVGI